MNVTVIMADYTLKELLYKQKRGEIHLAFAMYLMFLCKLSPIRNCQNPSIYTGFDNLCPIITHYSILRTIPVAFIYTFLLKNQIVLLLSVF